MKQSYSSIFFPTNLTLEIPSGSKECTQDSHDASHCDFFADKSQAAPVFCKAFLDFRVMPEPQYNDGAKSLHKLHINFVSLVCFPHWMKKQPTSLHKRSRAWARIGDLTKKTLPTRFSRDTFQASLSIHFATFPGKLCEASDYCRV